MSFLSMIKKETKIEEQILLFSERVNPFHATGLFLYPLKISENQRFSDAFRGYRKSPMA